MWLLTWATRLVAVLTLASVTTTETRRRIGDDVGGWLGLPAPVRLAGVVITLLAGVSLLLLAAGLRRRKRRAWQLAVAASAALAVSNLARALTPGGHLVAAAVATALCAALLGARRSFTALPDPRGAGRALRVLVAVVAAGFALGWTLLAANPRHVLGRPGWAAEATHAALALVGVSGPVQFTETWLDDVTSTVGLAFGVWAVLAAALLWLRSAEPAPGLTPTERARLRTLLDETGGQDSLGYFALRHDKSVVFSPTGRSAVTYRVLAGVALASGDPIGQVEAWPGAIAEFLALCRHHAWVPAVLGCSQRGARVWLRSGMDVLELGDEAVLDVAAFTLTGRAMRGVRQAVGRIRDAGCTTRIGRLAELPDAERDAIVATVQAWRGARVQRGYSMALSRLADPDDPRSVLVVARQDGAIRGVLQLVPWGDAGLSLDSMYRDPAARNGLNDFMIAQLLAECPGLGVDRVSLNFAVLRAALEGGQRIGAGPVARLQARVLHLASRWWQIEGLYRFNARFRPRWTPRYVAFPRVADLPRIALAAMEAEGFGGRPPRLVRLLLLAPPSTAGFRSSARAAR